MKIDPKLTEKIGNLMSPRKRARLIATVNAMNVSLKNKTWTPIGTYKIANSILDKGLLETRIDSFSWSKGEPLGKLHANYLGYCLNHGSSYNHERDEKSIDEAWTYIKQHNKKPLAKDCKLTTQDILDWIKFIDQFDAAFKKLNRLKNPAARSKQKHYLISPRVQKTLKEMDLDIDLQSIKVPDFKDKQAPFTNDYGEPDVYSYKVPIWSTGCKHNLSRFSKKTNQCHACGKVIRSGKFVPLEAKDKRKNQIISLWLGVDCARNLFNVKKIGIDKVPAPPKG